MADSDYNYEDEVSDEDVVGSRGSSSTRSRTTTKKQTRSQPRQLKAWESAKRSESPESTGSVEEAADGTIQKSVQEREEEKKRKRLRKDTKPFQRGIIRHVVLVLDLSEAMMDKDMRPNRYIVLIKYAQEYIREFFEQNPISQVSVLGMHDGMCIRVSELSGNPTDHTSAIQALRFPRKVTDPPKEPKGAPSLQNALELARATLFHTPSHGTREVIVVFGSLLSLDPSDIHKTIRDCVKDRIRVSIIGMSARVKICQEIVTRTNAGDDGEYTVATDAESLREFLLATTTPPVIRSDQNDSSSANSTAALMMMGFPSRVVEDEPTLCSCHGNLTNGGYTCSRCSAKVCSLPITCPSCQLTLLLSTHLARSYHHLFPLRNWRVVSWERARFKGTQECTSCLSLFPEPPIEETNAHAHAHAYGVTNQENTNGFMGQQQIDDEDSLEQGASVSSRYECTVCESHFCVDCDSFCHTVLHNCPGCLSQINSVTNGARDVVMTG